MISRCFSTSIGHLRRMTNENIPGTLLQAANRAGSRFSKVKLH
jgi:hypothetical protein